MQVETRKTGGQVDGMTMSLIDAAFDKKPEVRRSIERSLFDVGKKQPEMVLSSCCSYLAKHQKISQGHRVVLLNAMTKIVKETADKLPKDLASHIIKIASTEMTKTKDVEPDWQTAASNVLVATGVQFSNEVMIELLEKLPPGVLPHYFVIHTLGNLASANSFAVVPFLKDVFSRILPMLGMAKQDNMKWVFAHCIGRFSESVLEYVANAENAPYPDITVDRFHGEIYSAYDVMFNLWLKSSEPKIRLAIVDALGHMTHIMSREKLEEQLPKILPGVTSLYKKHSEHYHITQGLCMIMDAAVLDGSPILGPHLEHLLNGLHSMSCILPDFSQPTTIKNHNELLRSFTVLATSFSDRIVGYLMSKLEMSSEKIRVGTLTIIKHLINSAGTFMENKMDVIVSGVQIVLTDSNLKVRKVFAQVVIAMATHGYLELEGGHNLVEFIIRQCAINLEEERLTRKPGEVDHVTPESLRAMCENILHLITTTIDIMEPVLWPYLLELVMPVQYTDAMGCLCKNLSHLAAKKRQDEGIEYFIDFETQTNIPKPHSLISRLTVMAGHPLAGRGRGVHVLNLMKALCPIMHTDLVDIWDAVIPKLTQYVEDNADDEENWNQKQWEDLLLKFLSKSLDEVDSEEWVSGLGIEMGNQVQFYTNMPEEKNFLYKCMGVVMRKVTNKDYIQSQLSILFSTVKHTNQTEKEGCAIGLGFCAATNLDLALNKLEHVAKNDMVRKSTGLLGLMKDKTEQDVERIKSTVVLCYGYLMLYAPPSLITSRLETNIVRAITPHFSNVKDTSVKQNLIRCVELLGKALHPSHIEQPDFVFSKRAEFLKHMQNFLSCEPHFSITSETRALTMDASATLVRLNPKLSDADVFLVTKSAVECVLAITPPGMASPTHKSKDKEADKAKDKDETDITEKKDPDVLIAQALQSLIGLLNDIIIKDPYPETFEAVFKHLETPWLVSANEHERERAVVILQNLLETYMKNLQLTLDGQPVEFSILGSLLGKLIPRATDPIFEIRKISLDCIQTLLRIGGIHEGRSQDFKDDLIDAMSVLKERAEKNDPNILFSVTSDLAKVLAKKLPSDQLNPFIFSLMEGLLDIQSNSSSGACVVLNSLLRIRGQEMLKEVGPIVTAMHEKLGKIEHSQTSTGTLRAMRTLTSHHMVPTLKALLAFPLPLDTYLVDIWKTIGGDPAIMVNILEYFLDLLSRSLPFQEKPNPSNKKEFIKIATIQPVAITCALTEMLQAEECTELITEHFDRIFAGLLSRIGVSVGLRPPAPPQDQKSKTPIDVDSLRAAVDAFKALLTRCQLTSYLEYLEKENIQKQLEKEETYPDGMIVIARGLCETAPQHIPKVISSLNSNMSSVYDGHRVVATAFFCELINQRCGGDLSLVEVLINAMMGRLVDSSHAVRRLCIKGLGNVASVGEAQVQKYSTTILSAMMAGMDDKDDPDCDITLESMSGLSRILAQVDENNIRQILINICLRIRPCFEKENPSVRAAAITLFGDLSRFGDGPSKAPFLEQIHTNLVSLLLHMNTDPEVNKACKIALRQLGPLLGSTSINDMIQKHLIEDASLHYGEFMNDFSRLIIADCADKVNFYVMGCVSFFKSMWPEIKANAVLFLGFLLGNLPHDRREEISKEHVCSALMMLLKDSSPQVRCKTAESMSLLYDY